MTKPRALPVSGVHLRRRANPCPIKALLALASGREQVAAAKTGLPVGGRVLGTLKKAGTLGTTFSGWWMKHQNGVKVGWQKESVEESTEKSAPISRAGGIVSCQGDGIRSWWKFTSATTKRAIQDDPASLRGGARRGRRLHEGWLHNLLGTSYGFGNETSPGISRFVQVQKSVSRWRNIALDVDIDANRFACEYLYERFRKALDKRVAHGKSRL